MKSDLTPDQIEQEAENIFHWAQDAVMDLAEGKSIVEKDISADEAYEDPDIMGDLYGDRIYDAANGNWIDMIKIAEQIMEYKHGASCKALAVKVTQWTKHVEEHHS